MSAGFDNRGFAAGGTLQAYQPLPEGLSMPPPRRRISRVLVAAIVALALLISGGLGWWFFLREPDPVLFRLALSEGASYLYRVEGTQELTSDLPGFDREISIQTDGMLKLDVGKAQETGFKGAAELTIFSFVTNGSVWPDPGRIRRPVSLGADGSLVGADFWRKDGLPAFLLPSLSPLLPATPMRPGEETEVAGRTLFSKKDGSVYGETRFIGYEEVDGVELAVLEGVLTHESRGRAYIGTAKLQIDIRSRIDPSTGRVRDAEGAVFWDAVDSRHGHRITATETFKIVPMDVSA